MMSRSRISARRLATGLLVAMAIVFITCRSFEHRWRWLTPVRFFAEAAMVGALADWFAVVAIFRHPLGLPIPHTAILQERKKEIGKTLGSFVVENFLTREVVSARLERVHLAAEVSRALEENARKIAQNSLGAIPRLLAAFAEPKIAEMFFSQVKELLGRIPAAAAMGEILDLLTKDGRHDAILDQGLILADNLVTENKDRIQSAIAEELPVPEGIGPLKLPFRKMLAATIAKRVVTRIRKSLGDTAGNPKHPLREQFRERLQKFVDELKISPAYREKGEAIKQRLLADPALSDYASRIWAEIRHALIEDVSAPDSKLEAAMEDFIKGIALRIRNDEELQAALNRGLKTAILDLADRHAEGVSTLISETVDAWDVPQMVTKIEGAIGDDLQYIRINGTLIGGCVGLVLYFVQIAIWP